MNAHYPFCPTARPGSPQTAFDAAKSIEGFADTIRVNVQTFITAAAERGAIGDDVARGLDLHVTQVRSRISELKAQGKIVDSGRRRKGASGRMGAVWVIPEYGPPPPEPPVDVAGLPLFDGEAGPHG